MYLVTKNKKYLDGFLFYFYFYFAPSTQIFLKISRKTFYKKKIGLTNNIISFSTDRHVEKESLAEYIAKKREMFLVQVI